MKRILLLLPFSILLALAGPANADEEPRGPAKEAAEGFYLANLNSIEIFMAEHNVQSVQLGGVNVIEVTREIPGLGGFNQVKEYYEVIPVYESEGDPASGVPAAEGDASSGVPGGLMMHRIPPEDVARQQAEADSGLTAEQLADGFNAYAGTTVMLGALLQDEINERNPFGSFGFGMFRDDKSEDMLDDFLDEKDCAKSKHIVRWGGESTAHGRLAVNPLTFMMGPACFLSKTAEAFAASPENTSETAQRDAVDRKDFAETIEHLGIDDVDGKRAHLLRADGLNLSLSSQGIAKVIEQIGPEDSFGKPANDRWWSNLSLIQSSHAADVQQTTINSISVWIHAEHFVRLKTRMEGVMEADGQTQDFFLERVLDDYRNVPNSDLYMPYREVLRMGGMLDPEQRAEMQEAKRQLEDFERQMASRPASERAMMEKMMGSQMKQMRSLVDDGSVKFEFITTNIIINPDMYRPGYRAETFAAEADARERGLTRRIQIDLSTLGYEPGNTDGDLTQQTIVSIVKFESDNGMEVIGKPTPQVAAALADAVSD